MSFRRKTYDGDFFGGSPGTTEWGDPVGGEGQANRHAPAKRPAKNTRSIDDSSSALFSEETDKDRYLITYADLITLLLGLFIILYAMSNIDLAKYQKVMTAVGTILGGKVEAASVSEIAAKKFDFKERLIPANKLRNDLQEMISTNALDNSIKLEENERGIVIHILDDILFLSGNAEIHEGSRGVLRSLAAIIKTLPNDIRVEGHSDNVPIKSSVYQSNWHLSVARALNTAYYLINAEGLSPEKVSIVGYSEYRPVASNQTPEGRRSNRRVDIVILKNQ